MTTLSALQAANQTALPAIRIPVIALADNVDEVWWKSFQIRAKMLFAQQLKCCPSSLNLDATCRVRISKTSGLNSLEALAQLVQLDKTDKPVRCFAIIHDWSAERDGVEMVIVTDLAVHKRFFEKVSPEAQIPSDSFASHEHDKYSPTTCCERDEFLCWNRLCGPRFFIEWALHFQEHPGHKRKGYEPQIPPTLKPQLNLKRGLWPADRLAIHYCYQGVARRFELEEEQDAYKATTDRSAFLKKDKCPCVGHCSKK